MQERYYSNDYTQYNPINHNSNSYDWVIWKNVYGTLDDGYLDLIKAYIGVTYNLANVLRNEIGSEKCLNDVYPFLFCVRQSLELLLKRLCHIYANMSDDDIVSHSHRLNEFLPELQSTVDWNKYNITFDNLRRATDFLNDKDQLVKYACDKHGCSHENYAICISDWESLLHELWVIYLDGVGKDGE